MPQGHSALHNMPDNTPKGHQKLGAALKLLEKAPVLSVPHVMPTVGYLQAESKSQLLTNPPPKMK